MKKKLKIVGISILILLVVLIASPFIFQKQIKNLVRNYINNNVNAKVEFNDVNLSFLSSFPQANVTIDQLSITTFEPFKNDTLANVKQLSLDMSVKELFKTASEDPIIVNSINVDNALINLKTNKDGQVNWDIAKANTNNTSSNASNNNSLQHKQQLLQLCR